MIKANSKANEKLVVKTEGQRLVKRVWDYREMYILLFPALLFTFVFNYIPMYGVIMTFQDVKMGHSFGQNEWIGLYHIKRFFNSYLFEDLIKNTVWITLISHITSMPMALGLALLLHNSTNKFVKKASQSLTYIPNLLSIVIVMCILRLFVNRDGGLINALIERFGGDPIDFFTLPEAVVPMYIITNLWQGTGAGAIIYIGALAGVDEEMVEAARIDGASKLRIIWNIQLPSILPTLVTMFILNCGSLLAANGEKLLLMQTSMNESASEVIGTYVYKHGVAGTQYGYTTAIGLFTNIVNIMMMAIVNFVSDKLTGMGVF